jgi:hypothetical protein
MARSSNEVTGYDAANSDSAEVLANEIHSPQEIFRLIQSAEPGFGQIILTTLALTMARHGSGANVAGYRF